jgi:hypothetical protein
VVRKLKADKADKAVIKAAVDELLALKKKLGEAPAPTAASSDALADAVEA